MKRNVLCVLALLVCTHLQSQKVEDFGYRHFKYIIEGDSVDVLIKSKKGDENKKKSLFFAVQGSLAVPLIIHNGTQLLKYSTLEEGSVENDYHLVIVSKPGIPLLANKDSLIDGKEYFINKEEYIYPEKYVKNNYLDYYVKRNLQVIDSLFKKNWVDTSKLVISGHSQGSGIALSMCDKTTKATHLIYSSGLPYYSMILAMLNRERMNEKNEENPRVKKIIQYWKEVVDDPYNYINPNRDANLTLSSFSQNENKILKRLRIPVLISYGTKDESSPYQDMFRIETIKDRINHITFKDYIGLGHNYQLKTPDKNNQKTDFISEVVSDWLQWINDN